MLNAGPGKSFCLNKTNICYYIIPRLILRGYFGHEMKKGTGKPSRIKGPEIHVQTVYAPPREEARSRTWIYPLAVAAALIILLLIINPCSRCHNRTVQDGKSSAFRWLEWGIRSSDIDKKAAIEKERLAFKMRRRIPAKKEQKETTIIKPVEEKKVIDFGTKLELVPPPSTR
jgi:hypothetical protein